MVRYIQRKHKDDELNLAIQYEPGQWAQLISPSTEEIQALSEELSLESSLLKDATDLDEMPRFEIEDDNAYLYTRFAWRSTHGNIQTEPVLFVIGSAAFVSLTNRSFEPLESLLERQKQLTTNRPKHLLLPSLNVCIQSYSNQLANVGRKIRTAGN